MSERKATNSTEIQYPNKDIEADNVVVVTGNTMSIKHIKYR